MPERKAWTEDEDRILKYLREEEKMQKWSHIARKMAEQYKMIGRNGKQCRQRYHNHLDSSVIKQDWTYEEEQKLYQLHDQIGNKWAQIAQKMNGRTDNCVKNHFYSKLRKALRKLNKAIYSSFRKQFRELRMTVLYKIIEATQDKFKQKPTINTEFSLHSCDLKNMLLTYSYDDQNQFETDLKKLKGLIMAINKFSHDYKRKPKKSRKNTIEGKNILSSLPPKIQKQKFLSDNEDEDSDEFILASEEESFQMGNIEQIRKKRQNQEKMNSTPLKGSGNLPISVVNPSAEEQNEYLSNSLNVEYILKNAGILKDANMLSMSLLKRSMSMRSESNQSEKDRLEQFNLGDSVDRNFIINVSTKGDMDIDEHKLFQSN